MLKYAGKDWEGVEGEFDVIRVHHTGPNKAAIFFINSVGDVEKVLVTLEGWPP